MTDRELHNWSRGRRLLGKGWQGGTSIQRLTGDARDQVERGHR